MVLLPMRKSNLVYPRYRRASPKFFFLPLSPTNLPRMTAPRANQALNFRRGPCIFSVSSQAFVHGQQLEAFVKCEFRGPNV